MFHIAILVKGLYKPQTSSNKNSGIFGMKNCTQKEMSENSKPDA